jgi:hypothetical protein
LTIDVAEPAGGAGSGTGGTLDGVDGEGASEGEVAGISDAVIEGERV